MLKPRIVYLGTPDLSATVLRGLLASGEFNIVGVVTKPDQPVGRKQILSESPVAKVAAEFNLPFHKPLRLNKDYGFVSNLDPDLLLTFAYGQIVSTAVLGLSKYPPLNIHASLLPRWRGAAPIQYALRAGDTETGISLMEMVKEMDAGPVYARKRVAIDPTDNYSSLALKLADAALKLTLEALPRYFAGELEPEAQNPAEVTFCPSIKKEEEHLSFEVSAKGFVDGCRALSETPGGYVLYRGEPLKIYAAHTVASNGINAVPGQIVRADSGGLIVATADGFVALDVVQKAGRRRIGFRDFANGEHDLIGEVLK